MKRLALVLAIGALTFGTVYGFAASLNLTTDSLGGAQTSVAACQSGALTATYSVSYSAAEPGYRVGTVTVTGLALRLLQQGLQDHAVGHQRRVARRGDRHDAVERDELQCDLQPSCRRCERDRHRRRHKRVTKQGQGRRRRWSSPARDLRPGPMNALRSLAGVALLSLAGTVIGMAASLAFAAGSLGAADVSIPRCTNAGLTVLGNLSGADIASVTIGAIPASCAGATIQATVNNGSTNSSGSGTVPGGGGSVTVTLATAVAATAAVQTDIVLTGP